MLHDIRATITVKFQRKLIIFDCHFVRNESGYILFKWNIRIHG